jgi:hypothetical protein
MTLINIQILSDLLKLFATCDGPPLSKPPSGYIDKLRGTVGRHDESANFYAGTPLQVIPDYLKPGELF